MTSATIILTTTRPTLDVSFSGSIMIKTPLIRRLLSADLLSQIEATNSIDDANWLSLQKDTSGNFVRDASYVASGTINNSDQDYYVLFGEELGSGITKSLSFSSRWTVGNIANVSGWSSDPEQVLRALRDEKKIQANVIDPTGNLYKLAVWNEMYEVAYNISVVANVTIHSD